MKRFMTKKVLVVGVVVAVLLGVGGAAFAWWSSSGAGTGSAPVGTASPFVINQTGTIAYNSLVDPSMYQWSLTASGADSELGNEITLAGSPAPLKSVTVSMSNFDNGWTSTGPMTLSIYAASAGGLPGTLIAHDTETFTLPSVDGGNGSSWCNTNQPANVFCGIDVSNVTFHNFITDDYSYGTLALPSDIVYGITYGSVSGVNVTMSSDSSPDWVSVGSDTYTGYLFSADPNSGLDFWGGTNGELTCDTVTSTFEAHSTAVGPTGCGNDDLVGSSWQQLNLVPAVQFNTAGTMSDLVPGGSQPVSFSVYNPGADAGTLNTVSIAVASDTANGLVESIPGDTSTDVSGCYASWFSGTGEVFGGESIASGGTITGTGSISMSNPDQDQDSCQGATLGLVFTSN
jgi:hypothetical protein